MPIAFTSSAPLWTVGTGTAISYTPTFDTTGVTVSIAEGPSFLTSNGSTISGTAQLPGGYYQIHILAVKGDMMAYQLAELYISTPPLPAVVGKWRIAIFAQNGDHIAIDEGVQSDVELHSEPYIRLEESSPTKALVSIDNGKGKNNILSQECNLWANGRIGPIREGMQMVIDLYDEAEKKHFRVYNDTIKQISVTSESVEVVGHDCLYNLSVYRDPIRLYDVYTENASAVSITPVAQGVEYAFTSNIEELRSLRIFNRGQSDRGPFDRLTQSSASFTLSSGSFAMSGHTLSAPMTKIRQLFFKGHGSPTGPAGGTYVNDPDNYIFRLSIWTAGSDGRPISQIWESGDHLAPKGSGLITFSVSPNLNVDPGQRYFFAVKSTIARVKLINQTYYPAFPVATNSEMLPSESYYGHIGNDWYSVTGGSQIFVEYDGAGIDISPTSAITDGSNKILVPNNVLGGNNGLAGAIASFYAGRKSITQMVIELLRRAGYSVDFDGTPTRSIATYTTSTHDYLACIQELLGSASGSGQMVSLQASMDFPRKVLLRKRELNNVADRFTTNVLSNWKKDIISHDLVRPFGSSYATRPIILAEDRNGNPLALQSDDLLYGEESIEKRLGSPNITITTDKSLLNHDMIAVSLESQIVRNHRNIIEGEVIIDGIRPSLWSSDADTSAGGKIVSLDIPEYGGAFNVAARMMEIGTGFNRTKLSLDNVRIDNQNAVAQSISRSLDNQTYVEPETINIFVRSNVPLPQSGVVRIYDDKKKLKATSNAHAKATEDNVAMTKGYNHYNGLFNPKPEGYATDSPIRYVQLVNGSDIRTLVLTKPVYAWENQGVIVSIRSPKN